MDQVELHLAHMWDCPECGRENFCRSITKEQTPDEKRQTMAKHLEIDPMDVTPDMMQGEWTSAPEEVECAHCSSEFKTKDRG